MEIDEPKPPARWWWRRHGVRHSGQSDEPRNHRYYSSTVQFGLVGAAFRRRHHNPDIPSFRLKYEVLPLINHIFGRPFGLIELDQVLPNISRDPRRRLHPSYRRGFLRYAVSNASASEVLGVGHAGGDGMARPGATRNRTAALPPTEPISNPPARSPKGGAPCQGVAFQWVQFPPGNLSFQPVAIGAASGGNEMPPKPSMERVVLATPRAGRP